MTNQTAKEGLMEYLEEYKENRQQKEQNTDDCEYFTLFYFAL